MKTADLNTAIAEAERFLQRARALQKEIHGNDDPVMKLADRNLVSSYIWGSAASGACRRASMDLTRALAELRRK